MVRNKAARVTKRHQRHSGLAKLRPAGFSVTELMVAVAIAGLLAAVAYPSYRDQVRKGRRSDAISALGSLQLAQEGYRGSAVRYADMVSLLGRASVSEGGHYDLSIQNATGSSYTLVATARSGSSQAQDTACARMAITFSAGVTQYLAAGPAAELAVDSARRCWPQ